MLNHAEKSMRLRATPGNIPHWGEEQSAGWLFVTSNNTNTCVLEVIRSCESSVHSTEQRATETTHYSFITVEGNYVAICCVHPWKNWNAQRLGKHVRQYMFY